MTAAATLRAVIFETLGDAPGRALEGQFMLWCAAPRFRTFAATYADKIRKKLRVVRDDEGLRDVQLELEVAARLLRDRRFAVEYEKHATSGRRHPDLTVRFREGAVLHLEVKRVRTVEADLEAKCAEVICEAGPQLVPNALNVIAIALSEERAPVVDMARALRALRARAERKDEGYFQRRGYVDARAFLQGYSRLNAVIVLGAQEAGTGRNPLARLQMSSALDRALAAALSP